MAWGAVAALREREEKEEAAGPPPPSSLGRCELCQGLAVVRCGADNADLCGQCDAKVHSANTLVTRHARSPLCCRCHRPCLNCPAVTGPACPCPVRPRVCGACLDQEHNHPAGQGGRKPGAAHRTHVLDDWVRELGLPARLSALALRVLRRVLLRTGRPSSPRHSRAMLAACLRLALQVENGDNIPTCRLVANVACISPSLLAQTELQLCSLLNWMQ